jgi:hypothetical protein
MSYAGTTCNCGRRKDTNTLTCTDCYTSAHPQQVLIFENPAALYSKEDRIKAAIAILAHARNRKARVKLHRIA